MVKVVLDTNILVSSLLTLGPPAAVVDLVVESKIIPFYSNLILQEYLEVLSRKKFGFSSFQITRLIDDIIRVGIAVDDKPFNNKKITDEDDKVFYSVTVEAAAYLSSCSLRSS